MPPVSTQTGAIALSHAASSYSFWFHGSYGHNCKHLGHCCIVGMTHQVMTTNLLSPWHPLPWNFGTTGLFGIILVHRFNETTEPPGFFCWPESTVKCLCWIWMSWSEGISNTWQVLGVCNTILLHMSNTTQLILVTEGSSLGILVTLFLCLEIWAKTNSAWKEGCYARSQDQHSGFPRLKAPEKHCEWVFYLCIYSFNLYAALHPKISWSITT